MSALRLPYFLQILDGTRRSRWQSRSGRSQSSSSTMPNSSWGFRNRSAFKPPSRTQGRDCWAEKSTSYCEYEHSTQGIATSFPAAKILFVREPDSTAQSPTTGSAIIMGSGNNRHVVGLPRRRNASKPYDRSAVSASPFAYQSRALYPALLRRLNATSRRTNQSDRAGETNQLAHIRPTIYAFLGVETCPVVPAQLH